MHGNQEAMHVTEWFAQPERGCWLPDRADVVKEIEMSVQSGSVIPEVGTITRAHSDRCTRIISGAMRLISVPFKKRRSHTKLVAVYVHNPPEGGLHRRQ